MEKIGTWGEKKEGLRREDKRIGWKSIYKTVMQAAKLVTPKQKMRGFSSEKMEYPQRRDLRLLITGVSPREEANSLPDGHWEFITIFYFFTLKYEYRTEHWTFVKIFNHKKSKANKP